MATDAASTLRAIRDGEPEALANLCARKGAPVLAFCEHVAAPRQAGLAAAHAFQQLRANLVNAGGDDTAINLDELLLRSTRRAAAARGIHAIAPVAAPNGAAADDPPPCHGLEPELVAQIEQPSQEVRQRLDEHLATCPTCKRAMERLQSGQRAFDRPPRAPLPPRIAEQLLAALVTAAPVRAMNGDADAVRAQAWRQLGNGAGDPAPAVNGAGHTSPAAPNGETPTAPSPTPAPSPLLEPAGMLSGAGAAAATRRRPAPRAEANSLHALVSDAFEVSRHRLLGPRPGSVERPRQSPMPMARLRARVGSGNVPLRPAERRRAELTAIGLFVAVAAAVTLVTFMMASSPSTPPTTSPASNAPNAAPDPIEDIPPPIDVSKEPKIPPPADTEAKPKSSTRKPSKSSSSSEASTPKSETPAKRSQPSGSTTQANPPPPPPPPPPAAVRPRPAPSKVVPGGAFSTEGNT